MLLLLLVPAAPLHLLQATDALAAANAAAAAAATNAAGTAVAAPLSVASSSSDCISFTSLSGDVTITAWCEANCKAGVCPEDKCKCITAADVQQAAASTASAGVAKLGTTLPKIASKISGPWFYCADGTPHEPTGVQRHPQWGQNYELNAPTGRELPDWLASTSSSGNAVSLAFMDPKELGTPGNGVPAAFIEYTYLLRQGKENRDRQIFFAIGGMAFKGFDFLGSSEAAEKAGADACVVATTHGVGIEIDHEGSQGSDVTGDSRHPSSLGFLRNPPISAAYYRQGLIGDDQYPPVSRAACLLPGLKSFVKGFRRNCPMGKFPLSMDIMGGPGGAGLTWATEAVADLVPQTGVPGDTEEGDFFDFVNLMVIDACTTADCLTSFWLQWEDASNLNFKRATFSFTASGICDKEENDVVTEAWAWAKDQGGYGLRTWSVTPAGGGDWDADCDEGAPGLRLMCAEVGVC